MTATLIPGQATWSSQRDDTGQRSYTISHKVSTDSYLDGPAVVMNTPGLPQIGDTWNFDNDIDIWAFCDAYMKVSVLGGDDDSKCKYWRVEQKFSTTAGFRCMDTERASPLTEPVKVSGTFVKYTQAVQKDRHNDFVMSSSFEPIVGAAMERDYNRPTVQIEQNVPDLMLWVVCQMLDRVNSVGMWGLLPRCVKLSSFSWERLYYGKCNIFYKRTMGFDIRYDTFDPKICDFGTKALNGYAHPETGVWTLLPIPGAPSRYNPDHFCVIKDKYGETSPSLLNGAGIPLSGINTVPVEATIELYDEANFFILGIPATF